MTCTERHPVRGLLCVRDDDHTWHRAEQPAGYKATHVWVWGKPADP